MTGRHSYRWAALLVASSTILVVAGVVRAQQQTGDGAVESDIESLQKAEGDIQLLRSGATCRQEADVAIRASRRLKNILKRDPNSDLRGRIEQDLIPLGEILGEHDLQIAAFYMSREHGGLKGAESRLLNTVEEYPSFSKMDEVLSRLADISLRNEAPDEARSYLLRLVCRYPSSNQIASAFDRLNQVGFSWEGCDKYIH